MERTDGVGRLIATKRGLGLSNPGVKYLGYYYIPRTVQRSRGRMAHSTDRCTVHREGTLYDRLPLLEKDGISYYEVGKKEEQIQIEICPTCPEKQDSSWREEGKCWGAKDARCMSTNRKDYNAFIADYCGECPVASRCFQYGVETQALGVWGGVNLVIEPGRRERAIERGKEKYGLKDQ